MNQLDFSLSLPEKYRPHTLDEVVGNKATVDMLRGIMSADVVGHHSFMFTGPSGCGKTTLALIVKDMLGCDDKDFKYLNTSNTRGIDTIREIDNLVRLRPMGGKVKFYLLDECHKLTNEAQNALLRLLEQPPKFAYFALCTTEPEKLLDTIHTRCHIYTVRSLSSTEILPMLQRVCALERLKFPNAVLQEIAKLSGGSCRAALRSLDMIKFVDKPREALKMLKEGVIEEASLLEICRGLVDGMSWAKMRTLVSAIPKNDQEGARIGIINYLTKVLCGRNEDDRIAEILSIFLESTFNTGEKGGIVYMLYLACKV
jgi:DNA polymerase III gamma/tau subunit